MSTDYAGEIVILGVTGAGRAFRPSDWAERLASNLATMGIDMHMNYSPLVQPICRQGTNCLVVNRALETRDPVSYNLLLDFARDNDLTITEGRDHPRL